MFKRKKNNLSHHFFSLLFHFGHYIFVLVAKPLDYFLQWLQNCAERIAKLGVFENKIPNHVLVNEYLSGQGIMVRFFFFGLQQQEVEYEEEMVIVVHCQLFYFLF